MKAETALGLAKLAAVAAAGYLAWRLYKGTTGALTTANGGSVLNPANPQNPINTAAVSLWQTLTGSQGTIGADLYDLTHNDDGSTSGTGMAWLFGGPLTWAGLGAAELLGSSSSTRSPTAQLGGVVLPATAYASESAWLAANLNNPNPWAAYGQR